MSFRWSDGDEEGGFTVLLCGFLLADGVSVHFVGVHAGVDTLVDICYCFLYAWFSRG